MSATALIYSGKVHNCLLSWIITHSSLSLSFSSYTSSLSRSHSPSLVCGCPAATHHCSSFFHHHFLSYSLSTQLPSCSSLLLLFHSLLTLLRTSKHCSCSLHSLLLFYSSYYCLSLSMLLLITCACVRDGDHAHRSSSAVVAARILGDPSCTPRVLRSTLLLAHSLAMMLLLCRLMTIAAAHLRWCWRLLAHSLSVPRCGPAHCR